MKNLEKRFEEEYQKLNKAQKEAVDALSGPVMVIAGPGTGKTQILALRIANILKKTGAEANEILCLTFTNSAVRAMRERLQKYISGDASRVNIMTFHKFSAEIIDEFYSVLDFKTAPRVLEDAESVSICDQILRENEWEHLRPRGDIGRHFGELKSLVSLLKRERLSPKEFFKEIEDEIKNIEQNPENISSRGENKGKLKKEVIGKIESLERTKEIVDFYELYEEKKKESILMDHDDTIKYALEILEQSKEARAKIKEKYQYVLIDEHQDSSGAQNEILKTIWQGEERPDIFAVGDDRQLIYAFGGAKISHFEEFKTMFGKAQIIFLTHNYRSTEKILNTADLLLTSNFSEEKLISTIKENHNLEMLECDYPRDEIIACALSIKEKLNKKEIIPNECAILVPKNKQVVSAVRVLKDMRLTATSVQNLSLFETKEFETLLRVFRICVDSKDNVSLAETLLDPIVGIPVLSAHEFLHNRRKEEINIESLSNMGGDLFNENREIREWGEKLKNLVRESGKFDLYNLIQKVGDEVLLKKVEGHEELIRRVEVIRSVLHLALSFAEKNKNTLPEFIKFIERMRDYNEDVPLAIFQGDDGIKVLTLHGSKGLEFDFVWIAHMNEGSLMRGRRRNFKLPERIAEKIEEKDEQTAKRELYVAITRAKRFCTISYSRFSYTGREQELAKIVVDLSAQGNIFEFSGAREVEEKILAHGLKTYVTSEKKNDEKDVTKKMLELVAREYKEVNVSVSMLNNFFECPWKWYFRNLLKLPEPKSESLEFGNLIHSAIDKILKLNKIPSQKEIGEVVEKNKEAFKIVSNWVKSRLSEINKNHESEKNISVHDKEFPHLNIYGKIDLFENLDGGIRVTDFKTGNPRKKSDIEKIDEEGRLSDYLRQLAMYSYLVTESRKGGKVDESVLEFLEAKDDKERFYKTFIDEEKIKLLKKDIRDYNESIKNGTWLNRECHFKSYGKANTECVYCQMAEIY
jgi:DNA helicase-2/ATP-dependent DNA helicase PcrA